MWPQYGVGRRDHAVFLEAAARPQNAAKIAAAGAARRGILPRRALTIGPVEDYIDPLGAPPLGAMARLRSPSLFAR